MLKNQISRRTFIKRPAAGVASAAASGVLQKVESSATGKKGGGTAQQAAPRMAERDNALAAHGADLDFGKVSSRLFPLDRHPYYAGEDCHTFDENRNVIPGLYAAGNVQGSRFAVEYPITRKGVSHSMAMYDGDVAGKNAIQGV